MTTTITGYTADRMKLIEDSTIVSGYISGDDLILIRRDEDEILAGNVRGAIGPENPNSNPVGTIIMGGWTSDPFGYLLLDGRIILDGAVNNPELSAIYPSWVSGDNLSLPDTSEAFPMGSSGTKGVVSGSNTYELNITNLPAHTHAGPSHSHTGPLHSHSIPSHGHSGSTAGTQPNHDHTTNVVLGLYDASYLYRLDGFVGNTDPYIKVNSVSDGNIQLAYQTGTSLSADGGHGHTITIAGSGTLSTNSGGTAATGFSGTGNTGSTGNGIPVNHTPKNLSIVYAVKLDNVMM